MYTEIMRTTLEIDDEQRAQLLRLAARKGQKGFSGLVQEAIAEYLKRVQTRQDSIQAAVRVLGSLSDASGKKLADSVKKLRSAWRSS